MRFLVFATDLLPLPGVPTSGTALRTYGLIRGLEAHGHQVIASVPRDALRGFERAVDIRSLSDETRRTFEILRQHAFAPLGEEALIRNCQPDVVLCGHWPSLCLRVRPSQAVVVDLPGPHLLERYYQGGSRHDAAVLTKLGVFATADYFIVSGPSQRYYFLSFFFRAGVEEPALRTVTIPMPLDPKLPVRERASTNPRFIFGGVFLPWQDPSWSLRLVTDELDRRGRGTLSLVGGRHPNYPIDEGLYGKLFRELSASSRVTTKPMLPYEQFICELLEADVAVDLMKWNLERQLAITIRSTTYLWAGLPVIYNNYADLSRWIGNYDAGWCVAPGDTQTLATVLDELFGSPDVISRKSFNAQRLAREMFSWDSAVVPLLRLLHSPPDLSVAHFDAALDIRQSADFPVWGEADVEQLFVCRVDGLSRVECRLATHDRMPAAPISLALLSADRDPTPIAERTLQPGEIRNNEWAALDLPRVGDSAGRHFVFRIRSSAAAPTSAVSPWIARTSFYPLTQLLYRSKPVRHASLCFRTSYTLPLRDRMTEHVEPLVAHGA